MPLQEFEYDWDFSDGFFPDQPAFGRGVIPHTAKEGSNVWIYGREPVSDRGATSLGTSGGVSDLQVIGGQHAGCIGVGNIWRAFSTNFFTGNAYINGANIGSVGSVLSLLVGGVPTPAGLAAPGAPTLAATATLGRGNGALSVVVQAFRSTTGARSNRSAPSVTIAVQNKLVRVTFPTPVSGQTHWIIGGN